MKDNMRETRKNGVFPDCSYSQAEFLLCLMTDDAFILEGGTGVGKTFLALTFLNHFTPKNSKVVKNFIIVNKRVQARRLTTIVSKPRRLGQGRKTEHQIEKRTSVSV